MYMGHGLKLITFYVQKHMAVGKSVTASSRQAARGARICETGLLLPWKCEDYVFISVGWYDKNPLCMASLTLIIIDLQLALCNPGGR